MSFIAAILVLVMPDPADAFILLANLLNWPSLAAFYSVQQEQMEHIYVTFSLLLAEQLPSLSDHFTLLGLRPDLYLLDWIMTLYSKCCPLDTACRLVDLLLRDGEQFLLRPGLAILALYERQLLAESDFVLLAQFLARLPDTLDNEALFNKISEISTC